MSKKNDDASTYQEIERRRAKWLEWLEKEVFEQGHGKLGRGDNSRCCLGVACEVMIDEKPEALRVGYWDNNESILTYDGEKDFLPLAVQRYFGIRNLNPLIFGDGLKSSLTGLNDQLAFSHPEIAEVIKEHYNQVFYTEEEWNTIQNCLSLLVL